MKTFLINPLTFPYRVREFLEEIEAKKLLKGG